MKVTSTDKSIRDIFKAHYFKIPRFQRPYSWTLDNIEEFWNDVISENSGEYFIGSMVVYKISESLKGLVDGQQRLTTITIFLSALRNAFDSIEEKKLANGTHRFIEREDEDDENQYILQTETSYPYFQECIQTKNTSDIEIPLHQEEKNLESCFKFFTQKIKHELTALNEISQNKLQSRRIKKLKEIRDKILD